MLAPYSAPSLWRDETSLPLLLRRTRVLEVGPPPPPPATTLPLAPKMDDPRWVWSADEATVEAVELTMLVEDDDPRFEKKDDPPVLARVALNVADLGGQSRSANARERGRKSEEEKLTPTLANCLPDLHQIHRPPKLEPSCPPLHPDCSSLPSSQASIGYCCLEPAASPVDS